MQETVDKFFQAIHMVLTGTADLKTFAQSGWFWPWEVQVHFNNMLINSKKKKLLGFIQWFNLSIFYQYLGDRSNTFFNFIKFVKLCLIFF